MIIRKIKNDTNSIFLTFDDGPGEETMAVLDSLDKFAAKATFFVVAEKIAGHRDVLQEIQRRGHSVGNHSLDHKYSVFFRPRRELLEWVRKSEGTLSDVLGTSSVGFRPPAGVVTPPLKWALAELKIPLILWNRRFYDSVIPWTMGRALRSLDKTHSGDIILLHDNHGPQRLVGFLKTLDAYLAAAQSKGFKFRAISKV